MCRIPELWTIGVSAAGRQTEPSRRGSIGSHLAANAPRRWGLLRRHRPWGGESEEQVRALAAGGPPGAPTRGGRLPALSFPPRTGGARLHHRTLPIRRRLAQLSRSAFGPSVSTD